MTGLGLPVPQGFTITTEACTQYYEDGREINDEIQAQINEYIVKMEEITGKKFGDKENPLLVSVRSGARVNYFLCLFFLQMIILDRISLCFLYRILCLVFNHLCFYDIVCIQPQLIQHVLAIYDYIRQFLFHMFQIIFRIAPLKTFQQLVCFNR